MNLKTTLKQYTLAILTSFTALLLNSCGSGAVSGSATDPATGTVVAVFPSAADLFPDIPVSFTITGGTAPYSIFSSNTVALPVTSAVSGSTFNVTGTAVSADTSVDVTVKDAAAKSVILKATLHPSTLNNQVTFTPLAPTGTGCGSGLCTGGDAQIVVTAVLNGVVLRSRAIKFDVYQGAFQIVTPGTGALVNSLTVNTDELGQAVIRITATANASTQVATIQSTDVTSGLSRRFNFNIIQQTSGTGILSTLPSSAVTIKGQKGGTGQDGFCPSGAGASVDFYIFGGTPPYRVASPLPNLVLLSTNTVSSSGGSFNVQMLTCGTVSLIVTDATGRTVETAAITAQQGDKGDAATATSLTVSPTAVTIAACNQSATINLAGSGSFTTSIVTSGVGTNPYFTVSPTAGNIPSTISFAIAKPVLPATTTGLPATIVVNVSAGATITPITITNGNCP